MRHRVRGLLATVTNKATSCCDINRAREKRGVSAHGGQQWTKGAPNQSCESLGWGALSGVAVPSYDGLGLTLGSVAVEKAVCALLSGVFFCSIFVPVMVNGFLSYVDMS